MSETKRILIAESGSGYGGTAKYLKDLLALLDLNEFAVTVASAGDGPFIREIRERGWNIHPARSWRYPGLDPLRTTLKFGVTPLRIALWLRSHRIQIVHLNNDISSHVYLILGAQLAGCKVLCHLHGWRKLTQIERWAAGKIHQFISVTQAGADFYQRELDGQKVMAVPNGLIYRNGTASSMDLREKFRREIGLSADDILVTVIGRLIASKGQHVFLEALAQSISRNPKIRGLIVGTDDSLGKDYSQGLLDQCSRREIPDRVTFMPWQSDLAAVYAASDIVVQPSIKPESFGLVALEAMATGKPVIASRIGGLGDVVQDQVTGLLVEAGNATQLSEAIRKISENAALAESFARVGSMRARTVFNMEANARQIQEIYRGLLQAN